jgi:hypothetical protein
MGPAQERLHGFGVLQEVDDGGLTGDFELQAGPGKACDLHAASYSDRSIAMSIATDRSYYLDHVPTLRG